MCIPFVIWSLVYGGITLLKNIYHGESINWLGYIYRFIVGKSATPFYYIIVLIQLTVITPWLVKVVKEKRNIEKFLWFVTPIYLIYLYSWNFITGSSPRLYETLFPAWFLFYYLGIQVKAGMKLNCSGFMVVGAFIISCFEALWLNNLGMSLGFCTSQITVGSFLYAVAVIGWLLKKSEKQTDGNLYLTMIGDCSYGVFYIHMIILMLVGKLINVDGWFAYWCFRFLFTSITSCGIVFISQKLLKERVKLLKFIGFI